MARIDKAGEKILSLVNPDYMKKIPWFVRKHATGKTVEKIQKEHPELYAEFAKDEEPTDDIKKEMSSIINGIFEAKMIKHGMLQKGDKEEMMVCPKCGKQISKDSITCPYCGLDIQKFADGEIDLSGNSIKK